VYQVRFTRGAVEDVRALPKNVRNSLKKEISQLAANPIGSSLPLREPLAGWRSYHWRNYRIIFVALEQSRTIVVEAVGKRDPGSQSDIYQKLERLAQEGKLAEKLLQILREFRA
jgi:mRNA-degrading endonuclease RelE of RelBE toxin-antitoxin system